MRIRKNRKSMTTFIFILALGLTACSANAAADTEQGRTTAKEEIASEEATFSKAESDRLESEGFDTPEEAVTEYIEGLKTMDLKRMMSAFAVETYVEKYDFEANLEWLGAYVPTQDIKLPNANPLATDLNIEGRKNSISTGITRQYLTLGYAALDQISVFGLEKEGTTAEEFANQFAKNLNSVQLDSLKLLGFIPPEDLTEIYREDVNKENMAKQAVFYGADKIESRVAAVKISGEKYLLCMDVVNYGDKWFILNLNGNIGMLLSLDSTNAGILPGSGWETEWESLVKPVS